MPDPTSVETWSWEKKLGPQVRLGCGSGQEQIPGDQLSETSGALGQAVSIGVWVTPLRSGEIHMEESLVTPSCPEIHFFLLPFFYKKNKKQKTNIIIFYLEKNYVCNYP